LPVGLVMLLQSLCCLLFIYCYLRNFFKVKWSLYFHAVMIALHTPDVATFVWMVRHP